MELFEIRLPDNQLFKFTSGSEDIEDYKAIPIYRKELDTSLSHEQTLRIVAPLDVNPFYRLVDIYRDGMIEVKVKKYPENFTYFIGYILSTEINYKNRKVELSIGNKYLLKNIDFPFRRYSKQCPFIYGDKYCQAPEGGSCNNTYSTCVVPDRYGGFICVPDKNIASESFD